MTGAELRAWREKLGKDEAWIEALLDSTRAGNWPTGLGLAVSSNGEFRRRVCEGNVSHGAIPYSDAEASIYRTAYRAALEAEEARQAAERGPVEPVCPDGVVTWGVALAADRTCVALSRLHNPVLVVEADGRVISSAFDKAIASPALLEYAAALSRCRAAQHAASDKQRKLDAVRAAEEAHRKAKAEYDRATMEHNAAARVLLDARREAGL